MADTTKTGVNSPEADFTAASRHTVKFDAAEWAEHVASFDLNEDQKAEMLRTLWDLMVMFVDAGFGIEPTQQACGQIAETGGFSTVSPDNPVELKDAFKEQTIEFEEGS